MSARLVALLTKNALGSFGTLASSRLSILIFHRVHAQPDPFFPYEPDAKRFDAMMRYVAATYRVMTLGTAVVHLTKGSLPPRSLVITFDDGYADNAEVALPILKRLGLKATFFVSTGFLDGGRMWNDSVIEAIRACDRDRIDIGRFGIPRLILGTVEERRKAIDTLLPRIKYLTLTEREEAVVELQRSCGVVDLPRNLMMATPQVRTLHQAGMEIGAHTINHPILKLLPAAEAEFEIGEGRRQLQFIIDAPVDVFAYPNGKPDQDYDSTHVAMVRASGFCGAVSTAPGVGQAGDDLCQLPRFMPWGRSLALWGTRLAMNQVNTRFPKAV